MKEFGEVIGDLEIWTWFEPLDENPLSWVVSMTCNITVMTFAFSSLELARGEGRTQFKGFSEHKNGDISWKIILIKA